MTVGLGVRVMRAAATVSPKVELLAAAIRGELPEQMSGASILSTAPGAFTVQNEVQTA
jgi:hypothetical protein